MKLLSLLHIQQVSAGINLPERPDGMSCECWTTLFSFSYASNEGLISNENSDYMMSLNCTQIEMQLAQNWLITH